MKPWYEALFENYGKKYDSEVFTQGTLNECNFIEQEIAYNKTLAVLDLGCGTGRHSVELAKRGYKVTGADLSASMLSCAKEKAVNAGVEIDFVQADARNLAFSNQFDVLIMLCEGAFPLMETDEMNFEILKNAAKALKPGGKIIFTTLNGLFPLYHSVEAFTAKEDNETGAKYHSNTFDLMTFRDFNITEFEDDAGVKKTLHCNERYYVPSEITWLLKSLNFNNIEIYGAKLGNFSRTDKLTTEDFEMLVIAEKK